MKRLHNERGQTMVEFTLVLPVLLVVLFGIIQFGITFSNYVALTDAVRAGARTAAISRSAADPVGDTKARVLNASGDLKAADVKPTVTGSRGANAALASLCTQLATLGLITDSTS